MSLPKYRFRGKFTSYSSWSEQKQMLQKGRVWGSRRDVKPVILMVLPLNLGCLTLQTSQQIQTRSRAEDQESAVGNSQAAAPLQTNRSTGKGGVRERNESQSES